MRRFSNVIPCPLLKPCVHYTHLSVKKASATKPSLGKEEEICWLASCSMERGRIDGGRQNERLQKQKTGKWSVEGSLQAARKAMASTQIGETKLWQR